jgi:predicted lipoprotein with Yx(FWY)xxD motif
VPRSIESDGATSIPDVHEEEGHDPTTSLTTLTGAVLAGLIAGAGCGGGGSSGANAATVAPKTAAGHAATVRLASTGPGKVLMNGHARTLYLFRADHGTTSACTGACASTWPPLRATGKASVGTGLQAAAVGTTKRTDGKPQLTYRGHPLYTYTGDHRAGDTTGQGITAFGGGWFAVTASGAQASGSASGGGTGFGY